MTAPTQQQWAFKIGDGAGTEVFTQIEGMSEPPELSVFNRSIREATTIDHAASSTHKKYKFNRQLDGQEFSISLEYRPGDTVQDLLYAAEGNDAGVNVQFVYSGAADTETYEFNVLVINRSLGFASATDSEAVDMVTVNLKINSTPTLTVT